MVSSDEIKTRLKAKREGKDPEGIGRIKCPECGNGNPRGSNVCVQCGTKLQYEGLLSNSKLIFYEPTKNGASFSFEGINAEELAQDMNSFFDEEGYKLENGTMEDGAYGKGSNTLRFAVGAFAKRYKFYVKILSQQDITQLELSKAMSGAWGSVAGIAAMNKESKRIRSQIKLWAENKYTTNVSRKFCPQCGTENPDNANFCQECGTKL